MEMQHVDIYPYTKSLATKNSRLYDFKIVETMEVESMEVP